MAKTKHLTKFSLHLICALAYFPYPFIAIGILLMGLIGGSPLVIRHGINGTLLFIGYIITSFFVLPIIFSGSFIFLQDFISVETFLSLVKPSLNVQNMVFGVLQIYCLIQVYKDVNYNPFFSPFRSRV